MLAASAAWSAYLTAWRLLPAAPLSVRWCAACIAASWLSLLVFLALILTHSFTLGTALTAWIATACVMHVVLARPGGPWKCLERDVAGFFERSRQVFKSRARWVVILVGGVFLVTLARTLVAPPMGWDSLTYHLLKAGRWVQTGTFADQAAPDAWSYYRYFSFVGEVPWAWAMLPMHADLLLGPMNLAIWLAIGLGAYVLARSLGAGDGLAVLMVGGLMLTPAVSRFMTTSYSDNFLLAHFTLGTVFLARVLLGARRIEALFSSAAFGLVAGIKLQGVPLCVVALAVTAWAVWRSTGAISGRFSMFGVCALCAALGFAPYAQSWFETGSPLYPYAIEVGGIEISRGNDELTHLLRGGASDVQGDDGSSLFDALFGLHKKQVGFGPIAPPLLLAAVIGGAALFHDRRRRAVVIVLSALAAVNVLCLLDPAAAGLRSHWAAVSSRFVTPAWVAIAALSCAAPPVVTQVLLWLFLLHGFALSIPQGWDTLDFLAIGRWFVWVAPSLTTAIWIALWTRGKSYAALGAAGATALLCWSAVPWQKLRRLERDAYYHAAGEARVFDAHVIPAGASAIWARHDGDEPRVIAVSAGWDGIGHNWFLYPLLGSRLQNRVFYVPVTADGSVIDYRSEERVRDEASERAWIERLVTEEVEHLVLLRPAPSIEDQWARAHPEIFAKEVFEAHELDASDPAESASYRFDRRRASEWLAADR